MSCYQIIRDRWWMKSHFKIFSKFTVSALFFGLMLGCGDRNDIVSLSSEECHFFINGSLTNTKMLALLSDGRYQRVNREHVGILPMDEGRWTQATNGVVVLNSDSRFRSISTEYLWVSLFYQGNGEHLSSVKSAISRFLESNQDEWVPIGKIKKIYTRYSKYDDSFEIPAINIIYPATLKTIQADSFNPKMGDILKRYESGDMMVKMTAIPRVELEQLLDEISEYESADDTQIFQFMPFEYEGNVLLERKTKGDPLAKSKGQLVESFAVKKNARRKFIDVYVQTSKTEYLSRAGTTQPFLFRTEMNSIQFQKEFPHASLVQSVCGNEKN